MFQGYLLFHKVNMNETFYTSLLPTLKVHGKAENIAAIHIKIKAQTSKGNS